MSERAPAPNELDSSDFFQLTMARHMAALEGSVQSGGGDAEEFSRQLGQLQQFASVRFASSDGEAALQQQSQPQSPASASAAYVQSYPAPQLAATRSPAMSAPPPAEDRGQRARVGFAELMRQKKEAEAARAAQTAAMLTAPKGGKKKHHSAHSEVPPAAAAAALSASRALAPPSPSSAAPVMSNTRTPSPSNNAAAATPVTLQPAPSAVTPVSVSPARSARVSPAPPASPSPPPVITASAAPSRSTILSARRDAAAPASPAFAPVPVAVPIATPVPVSVGLGAATEGLNEAERLMASLFGALPDGDKRSSGSRRKRRSATDLKSVNRALAKAELGGASPDAALPTTAAAAQAAQAPQPLPASSPSIFLSYIDKRKKDLSTRDEVCSVLKELCVRSKQTLRPKARPPPPKLPEPAPAAPASSASAVTSATATVTPVTTPPAQAEAEESEYDDDDEEEDGSGAMMVLWDPDDPMYSAPAAGASAAAATQASAALRTATRVSHKSVAATPLLCLDDEDDEATSASRSIMIGPAAPAPLPLELLAECEKDSDDEDIPPPPPPPMSDDAAASPVPAVNTAAAAAPSFPRVARPLPRVAAPGAKSALGVPGPPTAATGTGIAAMGVAASQPEGEAAPKSSGRGPSRPLELLPMLRTNIGYRFMLIACYREYSEENILGWKAMEAFRDRPTPQALDAFFDKYVRDGADLMLNISGAVRRDITTFVLRWREQEVLRKAARGSSRRSGMALPLSIVNGQVALAPPPPPPPPAPAADGSNELLSSLPHVLDRAHAEIVALLERDSFKRLRGQALWKVYTSNCQPPTILKRGQLVDEAEDLALIAAHLAATKEAGGSRPASPGGEDNGTGRGKNFKSLLRGKAAGKPKSKKRPSGIDTAGRIIGIGSEALAPGESHTPGGGGGRSPLSSSISPQPHSPRSPGNADGRSLFARVRSVFNRAPSPTNGTSPAGGAGFVIDHVTHTAAIAATAAKRANGQPAQRSSSLIVAGGATASGAGVAVGAEPHQLLQVPAKTLPSAALPVAFSREPGVGGAVGGGGGSADSVARPTAPKRTPPPPPPPPSALITPPPPPPPATNGAVSSPATGLVSPPPPPPAAIAFAAAAATTAAAAVSPPAFASSAPPDIAATAESDPIAFSSTMPPPTRSRVRSRSVIVISHVHAPPATSPAKALDLLQGRSLRQKRPLPLLGMLRTLVGFRFLLGYLYAQRGEVPLLAWKAADIYGQFPSAAALAKLWNTFLAPRAAHPLPEGVVAPRTREAVRAHLVPLATAAENGGDASAPARREAELAAALGALQAELLEHLSAQFEAMRATTMWQSYVAGHPPPMELRRVCDEVEAMAAAAPGAHHGSGPVAESAAATAAPVVPVAPMMESRAQRVSRVECIENILAESMLMPEWKESDGTGAAPTASPARSPSHSPSPSSPSSSPSPFPRATFVTVTPPLSF